MLVHKLPTGRIEGETSWADTCLLAQAFRHNIPLTVHPGIGYDIISNHPIFNGAAIGRAAELDFRLFGVPLRISTAELFCQSVRPSWLRRSSKRASVA